MINYMYITTYYINDNWTLHKKILNFCPITKHRGNDIGMAVGSYLFDWGNDNISLNGVVVAYLKKKLVGEIPF